MVSARDREGHTREPSRQGACACHPPSDHACVCGVPVSLPIACAQYYNPTKMNKKADLKQKEEQLRAMQERHGVDGEQHAKGK